MNQKQLKQKIEKGEVDNFYIFCGEDYFLKEIYVKRIADKKKLKIKKIFVENEEEFEDLKTKFLSEGLFDKEKKLFYCKPLFTVGKIDIQKPKSNVIIVDLIECKNKGDNVVIFEPPTEKEISDFILRTIKKHSKEIDKDAFEFLLEALSKSKNTTYMNNTLSTLITYCLDKNTIKIENVKAVLGTSLTVDFQLLMGFIARNRLNELVKNIEAVLSRFPPQLFIHLFSGELIKAYASSVLNKDQFISIFKKSSFDRYKKIYKKIGKERIEKMISDLYELDKISKSSADKNLDILLKTRIAIWAI